MTMGFRMNELSEQARSGSSEARSFNPDQRIEKGKPRDTPAESFDPDRRLSGADAPMDTRNDAAESEDVEASIEKAAEEYVKELKEFSEVPDTIPDKPLEASELVRVSPEKNGEMHKEFFGKRADLRRQWEEVNGREWPKYEKDVVNALGIVVRRAGTYYDMHHIKPLCLGGKNEVGNVTPLHVNKHLTTEGIHRKDGACDRMTKLVEERQQ